MTDHAAGAPPEEPVEGARYQAGPIEQMRIIEALLFAAAEPLSEADLGALLPAGADVRRLLATLQAFYASRGVNLVRVASKWQFRTASDLAYVMRKDAPDERKLSRAAIETLSIIAYHQPVTRAEIEELRGVSTSKGTLDVLLESGWIKIRGRRKTPGRPTTFGTTPAFLVHFGLESIGDLPGLEDLKAAGVMDGRLPPGFQVPMPDDSPHLRADEDPDDGAEPMLDLGLAPSDAGPDEDETR